MAKKKKKKPVEPAARDLVDQLAGDIPVVYHLRVGNGFVVMVTGTPTWENMLQLQRWWRIHVRKMRAQQQQWEAATRMQQQKEEILGG